jgi:hypothetical protein
MANFRWHGFGVSVRRLEQDAREPAETLLAAAREQAALLVMAAPAIAGCVSGSLTALPSGSCGRPKYRF